MSSTRHQVTAAMLQRPPIQLIVGQPLVVQVTRQTPPGFLAAENVEVPDTSRGTVHRNDRHLKHPQVRLPDLARARQSRLLESPREKRP